MTYYRDYNRLLIEMQSKQEQANVLHFSCGWHSNTEQPPSFQHTWHRKLITTTQIRLYSFHHDLFLVPIFDIPLMQNSRASQSSSAISFLLPSRYPKKTVAESIKMVCSNMVNLPYKKINVCVLCYLLEGFFFISLYSLTPSLCLLSFSHMLTHPPPPRCSCLCVRSWLCVSSLDAEKDSHKCFTPRWSGFTAGS